MELQTVATVIEVRINRRPLTFMLDDFTQHVPISPVHLMYGGPLTPLPSIPDENVRDPSYVGDSELVQGYKHLSSIIHRWNEVWTKEYLIFIRDHHYGAQSPYNKVNIQPGDIVLLDSDGPKYHWPLGKVISVNPDNQGILRTVKVQSKGSTCFKTLVKLINLEPVGRINPGAKPSINKC
ncbi:uncharacterized protein [Procambarus clarkii]|uniref:uncharacterized protein n=1 Tax=Procambarus clarkii TaxID=6728 RepID=UPI003743883B